MAFTAWVALISNLLVAGSDAEPTPARTTTYRSSVLGFSIEYPASWNKYQPHGCGSGRMGLSEAELLRLSIEPVGFKGPGDNTYLSLSVCRVFDGDLKSRVGYSQRSLKYHEPSEPEPMSATSDFMFGAGRTGGKIVTDGRWVSETQPSAGTHVAYILVADGRRIELHGWCLTSGFPRVEPAFDAMARSLRLFSPVVESPQPDVYKRFNGPGFAFECPGDWKVARPYDDAEPLDRVSVGAPADARAQCPQVHIDIGSEPATEEATTLDAVAGATRRKCAGSPNVELGITPYENTLHQKGLRFDYLVRIRGKRTVRLLWFSVPVPDEFQTRMISYVLPSSGKGFQYAALTCPEYRYDALKSVADHLGKTFSVDMVRNPDGPATPSSRPTPASQPHD
jgi:hypothetical protein